MIKSAIFILTVIAAISLYAARAEGQFTPLPIGTATMDSATPSCPASAGWLSGGVCKRFIISGCSSAQPLGVTINYVQPSGTSRGTIVFFSGAGGTTPTTDSGQELSFASDYLAAGFATVQTMWDSDWEDTDSPGDGAVPYPLNILVAACRPATLLGKINSSPTFHPAGAMCAQGGSAGSAAVGYSLVWYGAKTFLNNVELMSGPVFSDILQGCKVPHVANVTICGSGQYGCNNEYGTTTSWTNPPQYIDHYLTQVQTWVGGGTGTTASCNSTQNTSTAANQAWLNMSIVNPTGGDFSFGATTSIGGWVCAGPATNYQTGTCGNSHCPNNSGSQGAVFHQQFSSGNHPLHYAFSGINSCHGEEGVTGTAATTPNGTAARTAIENDMETYCRTLP